MNRQVHIQSVVFVPVYGTEKIVKKQNVQFWFLSVF